MENNREYAKTISKAVKNHYKAVYGTSKGLKVYMTAGVKYPYITLLLREGLKTSIEDRKKALSIIYGEEKLNNWGQNFIAGNVWETHISMLPHEWEKFIAK